MLPAMTMLVLAALAAEAAWGQTGKIYRWVDSDGQVQFGDRIPPEYAEQEKARVDEYGITREIIAGKKTAAELEAEQRAEQERLAAEARRRADQALLVTYSSIEEIEMHRNRRVELFRAQARVTELFLSNQRQQLEIMEREAASYRPYSSDPDAPPIPPRLGRDIEETEALIDRQEENLREYRNQERSIRDRFERDIERFRILKGLDQAANSVDNGGSGTTVAAAREGVQSVPE